jgi:predicted amidohydrolase YtcJ
MMSANTFALIGNVVTMTAAPNARVVYVENGKIDGVGDETYASELKGRGVVVHDLGNRTILPGFIDPHVHFAQYAAGINRGIDCRVPACKTIPDVLDALQAGLNAGRTVGDWLIGYGNLFFDQKLAEHRLPTRQELDSVSRTTPIVLHCGGHVSVLNTAALALAGVERFISGGEGLWGSPVVHLDDAGQPTGVVAEIDGLLPIPESSADELSQFYASTFRRDFLARGVTAIGEMAESARDVEALDKAVADGSLNGRIALYAMAPSLLPAAAACDWVSDFSSRSGPDRVWARGIKVFADGGYSSRNAASLDVYSRDHSPRPGYRGKLNLSRDALMETIRTARSKGVQVAIHANGTRAQREAIESILALGDAHKHPPVRVEHLGNVLSSVDEIASWRAANVIPVMQPGFLHNFIGDYLPMLFPATGSSGRVPLRTLLNEGLSPVISSDITLGGEQEATNPLRTIWSAVARRSYWGNHIESEESISVAQALRLHTIEAARVIGLDHLVGSLEPGKAADIAVLDRDIDAVPESGLKDIGVHRTYVNGVLAYSGGEQS